MGRVTQQRPARQAAAAGSAGVRGARVAKSRKNHKVVLESVSKDEGKLHQVLSFRLEPPPGYTFIPAGNTQLTAAMKDFAKKGDHKVYAVSATPHAARHELSREVHRIGYHFPTHIVSDVCAHYGIRLNNQGRLIDENENDQLFMKIYQKGQLALDETVRDQVTINTEAKEIIKDLFPNIPDNDLFQIIKTAFQLGTGKVGTADEIPLVRRAQLAVVAHIRHVYTKYDRLLRQMPYNDARHQVEQLTLRKLVEWRGDEDEAKDGTRRNVDDAVREVIVVSDQQDSDSELEDGQVLENGDRNPTVATEEPSKKEELKTENRALSPAQLSSEEEPAPAAYRIVPQVARRLPDTLDHTDEISRQRARYAAWDRIRQEYRAGMPYREPAQVVTRIPLNQIAGQTHPAYSQVPYASNDPTFAPRRPVLVEQDPTVRPIPDQRTATTYQAPHGMIYQPLDIRNISHHSHFAPRRMLDPSQSHTYVPEGQHVQRRSASPVASRPVHHRRTPSFRDDDTVLPSIETVSIANDVVPQYQSRQHRQDALFRQEDRHPPSPVYREKNSMIDLTSSAEEASKRRRLSSTPPSPYLHRTRPATETEATAFDTPISVRHREVIDLKHPRTPVENLPAHAVAEQSGQYRELYAAPPSLAAPRYEAVRRVLREPEPARYVEARQFQDDPARLPPSYGTHVLYEPVPARTYAEAQPQVRDSNRPQYIELSDRPEFAPVEPVRYYVREPLVEQNQEVYYLPSARQDPGSFYGSNGNDPRQTVRYVSDRRYA